MKISAGGVDKSGNDQEGVHREPAHAGRRVRRGQGRKGVNMILSAGYGGLAPCCLYAVRRQTPAGKYKKASQGRLNHGTRGVIQKQVKTASLYFTSTVDINSRPILCIPS